MGNTAVIEIGINPVEKRINELCELLKRAYKTVDWSSLLDYEFVNLKVREFLSRENYEGLREFIRWREIIH